MLDYLYFHQDLVYMLLIIVVIFSYAMQMRVDSVFKKYSKVAAANGMQAHEAARYILNRYGLQNVDIMHINGNLTDHYDPKKNTIALSDSTFFSTSVAAIGVAAHEAGHAVQYGKNYLPIKIRAAFVPIAQIGSKAWLILFLVGMIASIPIFTEIGIILFACVVLFQLFTLPVEFDASRRAMKAMDELGLLSADELPCARKTLSAAAMTYVASLMVAIVQLLRLLAISGRRRN